MQPAAVLLSAIGNIEDFEDPGKLARTALVQFSLIAKRYSSFLQQFYRGIRCRHRGGKANIALARKFLGVIYRTLKNNWVFEDFPNFVLAS